MPKDTGKEDSDQDWETTPITLCGPEAQGSKLVLMDLSQVRRRPVRTRRVPAFWFTNVSNLKQRITHPEWGLWRSGTLTKDPQTLLSAPREYSNILVQKQYNFRFNNGKLHTLNMCKCCAIVTLEEVTCYETW